MALRDLLAKQRAEKEKLNGSTSQSVLQSGPKETAQQKEEKKPGETLPEKITGTEEPIHNNKSNASEHIAGSNSVVEQGPPAGLKGLALIRWKREHGNSKSINGSGSNDGSVGENSRAGHTNSSSVVANKEETKTHEETGVKSQGENGAEKSASQSADAQKINDGIIGLEELRHNLTYLANNIEQKELVGQIVRTIAQQLANSPELTPYMTNADVNLMVRGLRRGYQIAARKKAEQKEARASKTKDTSELAQAFKDAGLGDLGLKLS
jgi:hypothetical protein